MHQSPAFNTRLQQLKEGNPTKYTLPKENSYHTGSQPTKKLVILWEKTGRRWAFNYINLEDFEYDTEGDLNRLTLYFYSRTVTLKGYHLDLLFDRFMLDEPLVIAVSDQRYAWLSQTQQFHITEVAVK